MPDTQLDRLIQRQHELWTRMQEIAGRPEQENRAWSAEERTNWDAANTELDSVDGDIARLQAMAGRAGVDRSQIMQAGGGLADPDGNRSDEQTAAEYREAFNVYMRRGTARLSERQRNLLEANYQENENRAAGESTSAAGGYLVPPEFQAQISQALQAYGGSLQFCHQITTTTGAPLSWPTNDDTANEGAILAENTQISEQDVTFGQRQLGAYTYTSKLIRVPWALLQDSAFDLEEFLSGIFGQRLGRIYARHLISGTGSGQPTGLLTGLRTGATSPTGATPSLTYDNIIDLEHSVDPAYRNGGNCRFAMSDTTLKLVRKLKDSQNRPLWVPVPAPGFPPTINGQPYFIDPSLGDPAVGGVGMVFGDFYAGMIVRNVAGFQSVALRERYADFLQTGFFAFSRMDARPDEPKALAALKFGPAS